MQVVDVNIEKHNHLEVDLDQYNFDQMFCLDASTSQLITVFVLC